MTDKLEGTDALLAKLQAYRLKVSGPALAASLLAGGRVLQKAEQDNAPILDKKTPGSSALDPGALKGNIVCYKRANVTPTQVIVGPGAKTEHVAAFVEYGHRQVIGTEAGPSYSKRKKHKQIISSVDVPPHPWCRRAYESSKTAVFDAQVANMRKSLKER